MRGDLMLDIAPANGRPQRMVKLAHVRGAEFVDSINTGSKKSRERFIQQAAERIDLSAEDIQELERELVEESTRADSLKQQDKKQQREQSKEKSRATQLVELTSDCQLFHDAKGECYARYPVAPSEEAVRIDQPDSGPLHHYEVAKLRSQQFRRWLNHRHYLAQKRAAGSQAMSDAIAVLEGKATFDGKVCDVFTRVGEMDGTIYIDLCEPSWQVVEIDGDGWRIDDNPPVMFVRSPTMLPLPKPVRGGELSTLRPFVNIHDEQWALILSWVVAALSVRGPYPILVVTGEQGTAKSTLAKLLRSLVDPSASSLRSEPRNVQDLMIAAAGNWVLAIDNISTVRDWFSDALCRLSTGGGFATRTLYTDAAETVIDATRPLILTGIEDFATRGDLVDRSLMVTLNTIPQEFRRPESELLTQFESVRPLILGALFDAVSTAIARRESVQLDQLPRMADFARWAVAAEPGLGLQPGEFTEAYTANRADANSIALDSSPLSKIVKEFADEQRDWTGTATELLNELESRADEKTRKLKSWPATARSLSAKLRRIAPCLRRIGVDVAFDREGHSRSRIVRVLLTENTCNFASASSFCVRSAQTPGNTAASADANADAKSHADANGSRFASAGIDPNSAEISGSRLNADDADAKLQHFSKRPHCTTCDRSNWIDQSDGDPAWITTNCSVCGRFIGRRPNPDSSVSAFERRLQREDF